MSKAKLFAAIVAENIILTLVIIGGKNMQLAQADLQTHALQNRLDLQTAEMNRQAGQTRDCMATVGRYQAYIQQTTQQAEAQAQAQPNSLAARWLPLLKLLGRML